MWQLEDLVSELQTLGFDNEDSRQAARQSTSLSAALDWLCLNIPEEKLPSHFASGAAGKPVTVLRSHKTGQPDTLSPEAMDPSLAELTSFGYGVESCMKALESHKGDVTTSAVPLFLSVCSSLGCRDHCAAA